MIRCLFPCFCSLKVAFDWGDSSVAPSTANTSQYTGSDYMSVRWSGLFKPELSEIYTFFVTADNGVRIYVDGLIAVDQWEVQVGGESMLLNWCFEIRL